MARLPWGYKSRHCVRCGKVGPRIQVFGGYVHKYCMTDEERSEHNREMRRGVARSVGDRRRNG